MYKLLFDTVKETLLSVADEEKYFGAKIGFFSILHTWGQKLNMHPHLHCVVPGGGYNQKKKRWVHAPQNYLLPIEVLDGSCPDIHASVYAACFAKAFCTDSLLRSYI